MSSVERYAALGLQVRCVAVNRLPDRAAVRDRMAAGIERLAGQVRASKAFIGEHLRLLVLPEYFLTGFPMGEGVADWADKACMEVDGPEYQSLGKICRDCAVYLSGNAYELDSHFPGIYFQTSFIIDDCGEVILRYRRLLSMFAPTPHDVLDKYLSVYGEESLFPVVDSPLGRLAAVASEEILYPEISRALALRGAEVICHSSGEVGSPLRTPKQVARLARAYENHCYVVSANSAGIEESDIPAASTDGGSAIVDFHGDTLAQAGPGESMAANADVDIAALRHYRGRAGMFNVLSRQRLDLFADTYQKYRVYPPNTLLDEDGAVIIPDREHFLETQAEVIRRLREKNLI